MPKSACPHETESITRVAAGLRTAMDPVFLGAECRYAFGDCKLAEGKPSAGYCFLAALAVLQVLGGQIIAGEHQGIYHYWNRLELATGKTYDIDVTGDQFGHDRVRISSRPLYGGGHVFPLERYERLDPEINKVPQDLYDGFVRHLKRELKRQGRAGLACHLSQMPRS